MMDIVPALLERIEHDFRNRFFNNNKLRSIRGLIDNGTATYRQAQEYAVEVGKILSEVYELHLTEEVLPDGKMYYNIAERILTPTLSNNYTLTVEVSAEIQEILNKKAGLNLKAVKPKVNRDRIEGFINRISTEESFDEISWILKDPVVNFTQSAADETLKQNVDFQGKSGLYPKIIRTTYGRNPCKWCLEMEGTYKYPNVPEGVYRRHENCYCGVEYDPGDARRQNVWTKRWRSL